MQYCLSGDVLDFRPETLTNSHKAQQLYSQTKPPAYPTIPMTKEPNPSTIEASQGKALRPSRQH